MGIFSKNSTESSSKTVNTTIISTDTVIKGGIETSGSVFIDGKFEGVISAGESIIIGKNGNVIGEVKSKSLSVSGIIDGMIDVISLQILSNGRVLGKVLYESLSIDKDGVLEGETLKKNSQFKSKYTQLNHIKPSGKNKTKEIIET